MSSTSKRVKGYCSPKRFLALRTKAGETSVKTYSMPSAWGARAASTVAVVPPVPAPISRIRTGVVGSAALRASTRSATSRATSLLQRSVTGSPR